MPLHCLLGGAALASPTRAPPTLYTEHTMYSRTACAAAVMAVFALGSGAVMAQSTQPHKHERHAQSGKAAKGQNHRPVRIRKAARRDTASHAHTVVTAAAMPTPLADLTSDVVVLPTYRGERNLYQTTPFLPLGSIQALSEGTPGSESGISIRGGALQDTLVMIDGFRVSSALGTDFSLLPVSYGSRTEILRGPGSAIYGQNAGGGVIQLLSDPGTRQTTVSGEAGIGGRGYMQMRGRLATGNDVITGWVDAGRERGDGFDVAQSDAPFADNDQDGWKRDNLSGRLDARLSTATHVTVLAMRNTVNADFDGANALQAKKRLELTGVKASHALSPETTLDARIGQSSVSNTWNQRTSATFDKTKMREYGVGANHEFSRDIKGRVALERLEESYDSGGGGARSFNAPTRSTNSITANGQARQDQHLLNAALRLDDSNRYNRTTSYQLGYAYQLTNELRLSTNFGLGYRMPELADYYASPASNRLKQQRNQSVDFGARYQPDAGSFAQAILYRTRVRDRITTAGDCGTIANCSIFNVGRATIRGIALSVGQDLTPDSATGLSWQANVDLLKPRNNLTGAELPNVAKRVITGSVDYGLDDRTSVGADLVMANRMFSDEANTQRTGSYWLVNLRSSWKATREISLYGEVYNLGNRSYSTVRYYNQQPRTFMFGVSYTPR